jgi:hypothetical protein
MPPLSRMEQYQTQNDSFFSLLLSGLEAAEYYYLRLADYWG